MKLVFLLVVLTTLIQCQPSEIGSNAQYNKDNISHPESNDTTMSIYSNTPQAVYVPPSEAPSEAPTQPSVYQTTTRTVPIATPIPSIAVYATSYNPNGRPSPVQTNSRANFLSDPFVSNTAQPSNSMSNFLTSDSYRGQYQAPTPAPTVPIRGEVRSPLERNDAFSSNGQNVPYNYDSPQRYPNSLPPIQSGNPRPVNYGGSNTPSNEVTPNYYRPGTFDPNIYRVPQNLAPAQYYQGQGPAYSPDLNGAAQGDIYAQAHANAEASDLSHAHQVQSYNAEVQNIADSVLATCAAFVCVEFSDSTSYGTNTYNTFTANANQASSTFTSTGDAVQNVASISAIPGAFSQYAMYGLFPSNAAAFPFYSANGAQLQNSVAFGQSQSSEASTVHNDYYNDNHKVSTYGKKCSNYVCAHSADSVATRAASNYNLDKEYANANQAATNQNLGYGNAYSGY